MTDLNTADRIGASCHSMVESDWFEATILGLILLNALALGMETIPLVSEELDTFLWLLFAGSQIIFLIEIAIRIVAYGRHPLRFFNGFWNCFDFTIVMVSLLPAVGSIMLVVRLFRVLRILRILSVFDELRDASETMGRVGPVAVRFLFLYLVAGYVAVLGGYYLLAEASPPHWETLHAAFVSIVRAALFAGHEDLIVPLLNYSYLTAIPIVLFYGTHLFLFINFACQAVRIYCSELSGKEDSVHR